MGFRDVRDPGARTGGSTSEGAHPDTGGDLVHVIGEGYRAAPITLVAPASGALATALALRAGAPTVARAFRAITAGSITVTDSDGNTDVATYLAGEGYDFPLTNIVTTATVKVFY